MAEDLESFIPQNASPYIHRLKCFLDNTLLRTPKSCPLTNIIDQKKGETYKIPIKITAPANEFALAIDETNISTLLNILENIRCTRQVLHFSELQYFEIDGGKITKSGIDLDFDIYQKGSERLINNAEFYNLTLNIATDLVKILDLDNLSNDCPMIEHKDNDKKAFNFYACILRKPQLVEQNHKKHGKCWKESFRVRFPGIKITKEHKKYLIHLIQKSGYFKNLLSDIDSLDGSEQSLDIGSATHPLMFLGSAKKGSTIAHELHLLYLIKYKINFKTITLTELKEFNPIEEPKEVKIKSELDKRKKILVLTPLKYKYNLVYELSINYESPNGLIKKWEFNPPANLDTEIITYSERTSAPIIKDEFEEVKNNISDLTVRDYDANYIQQILDILSEERVKNYDQWKWIIWILAWTNPDYKPLAIWFSYRFPNSWNNGGLNQLEQNWEWALKHQNLEGDKRTISTIYAWAREDNPIKYEEICERNTLLKIKNKLNERNGELNETDIADILFNMFGKKYIVDEDPHSTAKSRIRKWYEFVLPSDPQGLTRGNLYKWRCENSKPDNLDLFISKKLCYTFTRVIEWMREMKDKSEDSDEKQKHFEIMIKNTNIIIRKLGEEPFINRIISRCTTIFRVRGFEEKLDTDPNVIGVGNGVLKVYPETTLIQHFHEIPITRSTNVDYEPYDPNNEKIKHLETEIKRLFAGEDDAFLFTMMYLASSLDGRKRVPLFFIWLGEGQNGKTFLLELHINTLRSVILGGYGAKLNVAFFTQSNYKSGGADSEKMMLKYARFAYCSESEPGELLRMSKIKEFTSETISGNEKFKTQDMFEANCHYVFCSNNDPRITGRDHGTWRRILVYNFKMKFISNPDPNNPYEHKEDKKFIEIITKDESYKSAYLSILVHYYEIYRDKYKSDISSVYSAAIRKDTKNYQNTQDTLARFINEQIIHIGPYYYHYIDPETKSAPKVKEIPMHELIENYSVWYRRVIDDFHPIKSELERAFKTSCLKKYIITKYHNDFLTEHYLLGQNEKYEDKMNEFNLIIDEKGQIVPSNKVETDDDLF